MSNNYTYNPLNDPGYYTGELSATSIVDQTDTYMAFCVGTLGRSEPEIIQSVKYAINVLIDENGEVYTPSDGDVVVSSIIKNVFGRGKRVQVRVISNTGDANLNYPPFSGTHTSMGPGFFQNILITTYGTGAGDFVQTMSFANAYSQDFVVENLNKYWETNVMPGNNWDSPLFQDTWTTASYMFSDYLADTPNFTTGGLVDDFIDNNYKLINYSTDSANTRFKVNVKMRFSKRLISNGNTTGAGDNTPIGIAWRVRNITTNTVLWESGGTIVFSNTAYTGVFGYVNETSGLLDMNEDDEFQIEWRYYGDSSTIKPWFDLTPSPDESYYKFEPEFPAQSVVGQIVYQNGINSWYNPYIVNVWNLTGSFNGLSPNSSLLFLSPTASGMFNTFPQQLDPLSEAFQFGGVEVIPFNQIRAGDFIRFGYWNFPNPNVNLHFIEGIYEDFYDIGLTALYVTPQVVTGGTPLGLGTPITTGTGSQFPDGSINNFNIYRIDENNNTSIVNLYVENLYPAKGPFSYLNPDPGSPPQPTLILFPENASQKLKDNYSNIIKRLTAEGVIY